MPRVNERAGRPFLVVLSVALGACLLLAGCARPGGAAQAPARELAKASPDLTPIEHVVVIYMENWSFDGLYGQFPGADGLPFGTPVRQLSPAGEPLARLGPALDASGKPDRRVPPDLPVRFFDLARFVSPSSRTGDVRHSFYAHQRQIAGGANTGFVAWTDNPGLVLSGYDARALPLGTLAQEFVLCDRAFASAFGGSFLNHQWLVAARSPAWEGRGPPPAKLLSRPLAGGSQVIGDAPLTVDGRHAVNTIQPFHPPHQAGVPDDVRLPPLTHPHIGDRMDAAGVEWAYYAGGWADAVAGRPAPDFQFHHQPFAYFADCAPGTPCRARLRDVTELEADLARGVLPAVAFVKPLGRHNEHPGYADVATSEAEAARIVGALRRSPLWGSTLLVVTYDEFGGRYDHVAPPGGDAWGPGSRVPMIVASPFARRGAVDHTPYETVSILALIERRWRLQPLSARDAAAAPLLGALDPGRLEEARRAPGGVR